MPLNTWTWPLFFHPEVNLARLRVRGIMAGSWEKNPRFLNSDGNLKGPKPSLWFIWVLFHWFGYRGMVVRGDRSKDKRMGLWAERVGVKLGQDFLPCVPYVYHFLPTVWVTNVSEILQLIEIRWVFEAWCLCLVHGIMECWNVDIEGKILFY